MISGIYNLIPIVRPTKRTPAWLKATRRSGSVKIVRSATVTRRVEAAVAALARPEVRRARLGEAIEV